MCQQTVPPRDPLYLHNTSANARVFGVFITSCLSQTFFSRHRLWLLIRSDRMFALPVFLFVTQQMVAMVIESACADKHIIHACIEIESRLCSFSWLVYKIALLLLCCPNALSPVGDPFSANWCGSPNHIQF